MGFLLSLLLCFPDVDPSKPVPEYVAQARAVQDECERRLEEIYSQVDKEPQAATTPAERQQALENANKEGGPLRLESALRVLELAAPHAGETDAVELLIWSANLSTEEVQRPAIDLLIRHHLTHESTIEYSLRHRFLVSPSNELLLRTQVAAAEQLPRDKRPQVLRALGDLLQTKFEKAGRLQRGGEDQLQRYTKNWPRKSLEEWKSVDLQQLETELIALFTRLGNEYSNDLIRPKWDVTYGDLARSTIFEIQSLGPGKQAPDIEGEDLAGRPMRLSDYRGKVILLSFWASWCGPCMELVPHEKELVARYKDAPFALVGVNADLDKSELAASIEKEGINWRSFSSGEKGPAGRIPRSWNVNGWPTIYVIDANGTIREKGLRKADEIDAVVEKLVQEAKRK